MRREKRWGALVALVGWITAASTARAQAVEPCAARVTRATVVGCAFRTSPRVVAEERGVAAIDGKETAASLVFPSNPALFVTVGRSSSPVEGTGLAWSATLSQEIEIAGQRGARLDVVGAERDAQRARLSGARREVAATALAAYFEVLAAVEEKRVADRLVALGDALARLGVARLQEGLGSELEAALGQAAGTRLAQAKVAADRHVATANVSLAIALGLDPGRPVANVEGALEPLAVADMGAEALVRSALAQHPELAVADAERRVEESRAEVYRRSRVPNVTVSIFAQNDAALDDRVFGLGLGFPIPLPAPLGHTYAGEIAESDALAQRAVAVAERIRRAVRLDVLTAYEDVAARKREVALFQGDRLRAAEGALDALARELDARRLAVRDALLAEQSLVELLQASIEARRRLCLASVELARVAGLPLAGGAS